MAVRRFVKRRSHHFAFYAAAHIRYFFGAFVNQQHHEHRVFVVFGDGMGDGLQNHRFTAFGRRDDQRALAFADGRYQINHALGKRGFVNFQRKTFVGVKRGEVFKKRAVVYFVGIQTVYFLHLEHGEKTFVVFGRAD